MMAVVRVEVTRRGDETVDRLLRRFRKKCDQELTAKEKEKIIFRYGRCFDFSHKKKGAKRRSTQPP